MKRKIKLRFPSPGAIEDCWQREATRVAIEKGRAVVSGGALPPLTPIGRISDIEWGWIVAAILFGWISTRARQATSNGAGADVYIRSTGIDPDPWDAGAIDSILPELANPAIDWSRPIAEFSREEMIAFLGDAYDLIGKAMIARDMGESQVTRRLPANTAETEADWDDSIPSL